MNERIQELVLQMGWEEMGSDLYGKSMDGCMSSHALEKFAMLVIKDCIRAASDYSSYASDMIEDHFGVK